MRTNHISFAVFLAMVILFSSFLFAREVNSGPSPAAMGVDHFRNWKPDFHLNRAFCLKDETYYPELRAENNFCDYKSSQNQEYSLIESENNKQANN
mgnify:CR=1 FL=1